MKIADIKNKIQNGGFDNDFIMLYGDAQKACERYFEAVEEFEKLFPTENDVRLFSAPGRTEVGGNTPTTSTAVCLQAVLIWTLLQL